MGRGDLPHCGWQDGTAMPLCNSRCGGIEVSDTSCCTVLTLSSCINVLATGRKSSRSRAYDAPVRRLPSAKSASHMHCHAVTAPSGAAEQRPFFFARCPRMGLCAGLLAFDSTCCMGCSIWPRLRCKLSPWAEQSMAQEYDNLGSSFRVKRDI